MEHYLSCVGITVMCYTLLIVNNSLQIEQMAMNNFYFQVFRIFSDTNTSYLATSLTQSFARALPMIKGNT